MKHSVAFMIVIRMQYSYRSFADIKRTGIERSAVKIRWFLLGTTYWYMLRTIYLSIYVTLNILSWSSAGY